ncbi:MAG: carboxylesterase family protein [Bacillota bacterium]|nr:carboxylesterase family protein [Bacillota bacterium]HOB92350.1 carboxylesterase family protein [Bacillota bacterium]HPZ55457.1 carboxylesterase family protein [Bacillota bacterium]HQD18872.1 carboxylesterase family protein [Bacillota bacterium]
MLREVRVENGIVRGLPAADPRITSFKGIPFAAPPVGKNRWRAPQPAQDWEGVLEAFQFAPIAMQARPGVDKDNIYSREWHVDPDIPMSEDCLYLNVWTPAKSPDERLPVFVWYFGGGLQVGYPSEMEFDGERIARRGVVVVTINYRLNVFGFLCHPEITKEAPDAPANFGHLDQQFATRWVQRNIAAFGGDPDNITIGGQSAGGGSVLAQLTSPQNEGLCQRAIIQSGIFAPVYPSNHMPPRGRSLADAERDGVRFFETLGVSSLEEARSLDAEYIMAKALEYKGFWGTVVDGAFCVGNPFELFLDNKRLTVPVLLGHTSDEFFSKPRVETKDQLKDLAVKMFGDDADEFLRLCGFESGSIDEVLERASVNSIEYAIRLVGKANADTGANTPLYYYVFDAEIPGWDNPGTFHSVDLWFFFETLAKCWRPFVGKHYDLARQMCNYWANFIKTGDPNGKDATGEDMPQWSPYTPQEPYGMVFCDRSEFTREKPSALVEFLVEQYFKKER